MDAAQRTPMTVEDHARAFVVRAQGRWREADAEAFRSGLGGCSHALDAAAFGAALEEARTWFFADDAHIFVCAGEPCRTRSRDTAAVTAWIREHARGVRLSFTGCHGPCEHAPVATLRVGGRCAMFEQVHDVCDWDAVLDYAGRAAAARTLLVDPSHAESFRFDPVHDHGRASKPLQRLAFLVGHFVGEGVYPGRTGSFRKEVVGSWEAGGRFIGLRMAVTNPLADGRNDVHEALVLVGYDGTAATYHARAYTDSGTTMEYTLAFEDDRVIFTDRVPGHVGPATGARKILAARAGGYDESLEVRYADGPFEPYSCVELRPLGGRSQP